MKFEEAERIGIAVGLEHNYEFVNNAIGSAMSMFPYDKVAEEVEELKLDAKNNGVKFAQCGCANDNEEDELCYICRKLNAVNDEAKNE